MFYLLWDKSDKIFELLYIRIMSFRQILEISNYFEIVCL